MIDRELLSYLELVPKNSTKSNHDEKNPEINLNKSNRKLMKFLTKIPFTILYSYEHLIKLSNSIDFTKFDSSFRKIKYIGYDYEKYINNETFVHLNERYPKRKPPSKLEQNFKNAKKIKKSHNVKCLVMTKKMSLEQILENVKISKETQDFILRKLKINPKTSQNMKFFTEENDQAISVECQFGDHLNESNLSLYGNECSLVDEFNKKNHNRENSIWFDYFNYNECENFYEHPKNLKHLNQQFFRKSKLSQKPNKPLVCLNENYELIDLTNDVT